MTNLIDRRRFALRSLAGSLALPVIPSLMAADARASSAVAATSGAGVGARRFVAVGNLLGFQQKHFFPETTGREFEETTLLKPLADNREQITVYRGLDHGIRGGHFAVHTFLSGVLHHESKNRRDGNVTLDQFIADEIGTQTRFASLTVGSEGGIHGGCQMSWTKSGVRVPPITGPADLFKRLFVSDTKERRAQQVVENSLQASILDSVAKEAGSLSKRVNQEDRSKLDEYFSSIRDVEKRLQARQRWADQPKPEAPFEHPADTNTVDDLPMLYELIALALQTDSTRVATLEIGGSFLPQNLGIDKSYKFLSRLTKIQDGEQTLLDSTAVLFGSGMGNGSSHTNSDLPIVLAGGGYGKGEFKELPTEGAGKTPLCNLYVDIAQKTGVQTDVFGKSTGIFS